MPLPQCDENWNWGHQIVQGTALGAGAAGTDGIDGGDDNGAVAAECLLTQHLHLTASGQVGGLLRNLCRLRYHAELAAHHAAVASKPSSA